MLSKGDWQTYLQLLSTYSLVSGQMVGFKCSSYFLNEIPETHIYIYIEDKMSGLKREPEVE